ncbi:unnamed protein product, partial [Ectocarpus fasciculatus]
MSARKDWEGEPRVIYHDVRARVTLLQARRAAAHHAGRKRESEKGLASNGDGDKDAASGGGGGGGGGGSGGGSGGGNAKSSGTRFVSLMFDPPGRYNEARHRPPEVFVIDAIGRERRRPYYGLDIGPLDVGSVIVLRDAPRGEHLAAYLVGEEEHQVFIVGNGVACAPTLLGEGYFRDREMDGSQESGRGGGAGSSLGGGGGGNGDDARRHASTGKPPFSSSPDSNSSRSQAENLERAARIRGQALR